MNLGYLSSRTISFCHSDIYFVVTTSITTSLLFFLYSLFLSLLSFFLFHGLEFQILPFPSTTTFTGTHSLLNPSHYRPLVVASTCSGYPLFLELKPLDHRENTYVVINRCLSKEINRITAICKYKTAWTSGLQSHCGRRTECLVHGYQKQLTC